MKLRYGFALPIGACFAFLAAESSNLAERAEMLKKAFKVDDMDIVLENVNEAEQAGKIAGDKSADDKNYAVIVRKEEDGSFVRVAHFKKSKVGTKITEPVLLKVVEGAEKKLTGTTETLPYEFEIGDAKYFAAIAKHGNYLVFNITASKAELDDFLNIKDTPKSDKTGETAETTSEKPSAK